MFTENPRDLELEKLLEDILKTKPETPECPEDKEHGKCLVWTPKRGWRTV